MGKSQSKCTTGERGGLKGYIECSEEWKKRLLSRKPDLVDNLDQIPELLDHLEARNVLSQAKVEDIRANVNKHEKGRLIVEAIRKRPKEDFKTFLDCLCQTHNDHLTEGLCSSCEGPDGPAVHKPKKRSKTTPTIPTASAHGKTTDAVMAMTAQSKSSRNDDMKIWTAVFNNTILPTGTEINCLEDIIIHLARKGILGGRHIGELLKMTREKASSEMLKYIATYGKGEGRFDATVKLLKERHNHDIIRQFSKTKGSNHLFSERDLLASLKQTPKLQRSASMYTCPLDQGLIIGGLMKKELQMNYKRNYRTIQPLTYRPDVEVNTAHIRRNYQCWEGGRYQDIDPDAIFNSVRASSSTGYLVRIVLESPPGFGKSCVVKKLANMWSENDSHLQQFDLVFLIQVDAFLGSPDSHDGPGLLKYLTSTSFFPTEFLSIHRPEEIQQHIEQNPQQILFLVDTNYQPVIPDGIADLFLGKLLPESTVLMTCRTNKLPGSLEAAQPKKVLITRHKIDTLYEHIDEYFTWKKRHDVGLTLLERLGLKKSSATVDSSVLKLLTLPQILLFVCMLWEEYYDCTYRTDSKNRLRFDEPHIYGALLKNILRKFCCSQGREEVCDIISVYQEEINYLGKLALDSCIMRGVSIITKTMMRENMPGSVREEVMIDFGLLQPKTILNDGAREEVFIFIDDVWMFYLAAQFMKNELAAKKRSDEDLNSVIQKVKSFDCNVEYISELFDKFVSA